MAVPPSISMVVDRELWERLSECNQAKRPKKQIRISPNPFSLENLCVCSRSFLSQYGHLLRSSSVSKHTRLKGRVVESAVIRSCREHSGPDRWHNCPWSGWGGGRQGTDRLPALWNDLSLRFEEQKVSGYL